MSRSNELLVPWALTIHERSFVVEVIADGCCLLFDEANRRKICHKGMTGTEALLHDIHADDPSPEQALNR